MNNKRITCATLVLTVASVAATQLIQCTPAAAHPTSQANKSAQTTLLPALAGSAIVANPKSKTASAVTHTSTIPLLAGMDEAAPAAAGSASSGAKSMTRTMNVGESDILEFDKISTSAVGDPAVADITPVTAYRLLISAKGTGHTTVFVYDRHGKNTISVTVLPSENMNVLAAKIEEVIGIPTVTVQAINDTIFLEGSVPTAVASARAEEVAKAYTSKVVNNLVIGEIVHQQTLAERYSDLLNENLGSAGIVAKAFDEKTLILTGKYAVPVGSIVQPLDPSAIDKSQPPAEAPIDPLKQLLASLPKDLMVINLINFERGAAKQILVRAKIVDIDRNSSKNLGIDWGTLNNTTSPPSLLPQPILFGQINPGLSSNRNSLAGGGPLARVLPWAAQLSALIRENKARVLSEPQLLVLDGNQANMLVGGEFPIPVIQGNSAGAVTIQFKPFGVRLSIQPTVVADDTIQLSVTPEVSDLDFSSGVQINGTVVPGLIVRRETTTLQLKDSQTLVIGGLYSSNSSKNVTRIPLLSQIPVIGEFFKNTTTLKNERELLVMIESEIITPASLGATPPPAGSLENMNIPKPFVPRREFDQTFPDLENGPAHKDPEAPKVPVIMPGTGK